MQHHRQVFQVSLDISRVYTCTTRALFNVKKLQNQIHNDTITRPESDNKLRKADVFFSMFQIVIFSIQGVLLNLQ